MDPLSDVLSLLKLRSYVSGGLDAGGDWAVSFGRHDGIKFHAVVTGSCWISVEGESPVRISAGECFLLPRGRPFRIASDLSVEPVHVSQVMPPRPNGRILTYQGGGDYLSIGGYFTLSEGQSELLLNVLPPLLHIRDRPGNATLQWCVERMRQELLEGQPGDFIVAQQLATIVLVQALRLYLSDRTTEEAGWLSALADKRLRAAIAAMHEAPGQPWTLQEMAERATERPEPAEVVAELIRFMREVEREMGERAASFLRKFYGWYLRGMADAKSVKPELTSAPTVAEAEAALLRFCPGARERLAEHEAELALLPDTESDRLLDLPISIYGGG